MQSIGSLVDRPATITWEVTRGAMEGHRSPRFCTDLTARECRNVVDQIAEAAPQILLISGDVVARRDLVEIIARADAHGIWVALRPAIRRGLLDVDFGALRHAGLRSLSVNLGSTRTAGMDRRISTALDVLTAARRARLAIQIKTTLPDFDDLPRVIRVMRSLQPAEWRTSLPVPRRGEEPLNPNLTEKMLSALSLFPSATGVPLGISNAPHIRRISIQAHAVPHPRRRRIVPLNDGRGRLFVSHRGEIMPGSALPIACGNVRLHHLLDIYREAPVFQRLRNPNLLRGKCGRCGFRLVCGGSRARAYAATGDYLASDPACAFASAAPRPASDEALLAS